MRTTILTSLLVVLLSVANAYAGSPKTRVYSNNDDKTKEYVTVDKETSKVLDKTVYKYSTDGSLQERVLYKWVDKEGWVGVQKYSYEYNNKGQVVDIAYTTWDQGISTWSLQSQHLQHIYDAQGELLAVVQVNTKDNLTAIK
ncbi:MAG: DUF3836 domain-containing protein [Dysgonomonas mossii]|nr:DUF3836 domain-containing protein [Dysgonomonas mossii]MBS7112087.1 DUF3836 domain-containing protein [Dysgonomonas mossii]